MPTGLPLLSGPPPANDAGRAETSCRKCNKEFNVIFTRSRRCNHCGYAYCQNCTDYQALMPRESGYDSAHVCAFCIENLQITAAGKGQLRSLPLAKLKKYAAAYGISIDHAVEKDDIVDVLIAARGPNGCLSLAREQFYRTYSVPNRSTVRGGGLFSRSTPPRPPPAPPRPPQQTRPEFARPDLAPDDPPPPPPRNFNTRPTPPPPPPPQQQQQQPPRPPPRPQSNTHYQYNQYHRGARPGYNPHYRPPPPNPNTRPPTGASPYGHPGGSRSSHNLNTPTPPNPRPRAASSSHPNPAPHPASPPQPTPTLDQLLEMSQEQVASLSIGILKAILFQNHVTVGNILEKGDLVKKVNALIEDEKRERERVRLAQEREDQERVRLQHEMMEEHARAQREREEARAREQEAEARRHQDSSSEGQDVDMQDMTDKPTEPTDIPLPASPPSSPASSPPSTSPMPKLAPKLPAERSGLCVVCQDEDANIAIVDCGHLCLCRGCCDMVMSSSRECPLCRTRIVTEARLLRIFKS